MADLTQPPAPKRRRPIERLQAWVLSLGFAFAALGTAVRLAWFQAAKGESFFYAHVQDSALYHELAQRVLAEGLPLAEPFAVAPLYAFFLAGVYRVFGLDPAAVYLIQIAMSAVTIGLTVHLGRKLFGRWGAFTGGLVAALYPVAIVFDVRLLSVSMGTFATVALAVVAHRAWESGRASAWCWAGAVLGLGALVRGNLLLVAPGLVLIALWRGRLRLAVPAVMGLALALAPATWHNHSASGEFVPISLGGGINLYRGNNPHFETMAVHPFRLPPQRDGLLSKSRLIASIETDTDLSAVEADRYWLVRTVKTWADDPLRGVGLLLRKLTQVVGPREYGDHMNLDATVSASPVLSWIPPLIMPVSVLALLGMWSARRSRDAAVFAVVVGGALSVALFFVVSRYRLPLVPLLGIYAGGGLGLLWTQAKGRRRWPLWASGAVAGCALYALAVPPNDASLPWNQWAGPADTGAPCAIDQHKRRKASLESRFELGVFALNHGRLADAEEVMWAVFREDPGHTAAGVNLSWLLLQKGAVKEAETIAERVLSVDKCDDKAWSNLATARLRRGAFADAKRAANRATTIDPYSPGYWSLLGESELAMGKVGAAKALFERTVRWAPEIWQARARLGRIFLDAGEYNEASKHLQVAVGAQPQRAELVGLLGLAEVGRGNNEGARKLLAAAVRSGQRGPTLTALARAVSGQGAK